MSVLPGSIRVLHVDDEPNFADMVAEFLEREDDRITVETAESAGVALDRLAKNGVDCIVSDYNMPGENGIEFLESIREDHPDLPFILFTGKGSEEVASEAISAGVTDYLQKEAGINQYAILANRIDNTVAQYRAEAAIVDTHQRYQRIIEQSSDIIAVVGSEGDFDYLSPSVERVLGYRPDDLVGERAFEYVHSDDRETAMERFFAMVEEPDLSPTVEFRFEHDDGSWRWLEARGRNLLDDPVIAGLVVYLRDVTRRKERVQALREEKERFELLVGEVHDYAIFMLDPGGHLVSWNEGARRIKGYEADEVIGEHFSIFYTDADAKAGLPDRMLATAEREGRAEDEGWRVRKDGTPFWALVSITALHDEDGELRGFGKVTRDMTDRRRQDERRYEAIFNQTHQFTGLMEPDGTLVEINDTALEFGNLDREDVIGEPFWQTYWWQTDEAAQRKLRDAIDRAAEGEFVRYEVEMQGGDENAIIDFSIRPITDEQGDVTLLIPEGRDVTERKKRERENERLEEFASIVSHELRNPLNVAEGRLDLVQEECANEHLEAVARAHDRMEALIEDLLELAREGGEVGDYESIRLADIVDRCRQTVVTEGATLEVETERTVMADRSRFQQLMENLIRNAVQHGGDEVSITIGDLDDGFYVADDGPGISEGDRGQIFDAGYTTSPDGTGFGLSIVREIADAHGWKIDVRPAPDGGTRFEISGVQHG